MRQRVLEAGDLCNDCRHSFVQLEIVVVDEEASDPAEIKGWEKILEIEVEDVAPPLVSARIGDDRVFAAESVREGPPPALGLYFISTGIKDICQVSLQFLELRGGSRYLTFAAATLGTLNFLYLWSPGILYTI